MAQFSLSATILKRREVGRNQQGQREEQNGDTLEEGGLRTKRSHSERAPVERTGKKVREGV